MLLKISLTVIAIGISGFFGIIMAIGSHGNPDMMLAAVFVSTVLGLAIGLSIYAIWSH